MEITGSYIELRREDIETMVEDYLNKNLENKEPGDLKVEEFYWGQYEGVSCTLVLEGSASMEITLKEEEF